jgi:hypothetical protein
VSAYPLARKSPQEVRAAVESFAARYVRDWDAWVNARPKDMATVFGQVLRRWQATRPRPMRRPQAEAVHEPPYLDDLLAGALPSLERLGRIDVATVQSRTPEQADAFAELWATFEGLTSVGRASCVGVSKAVLLVTYGKIGPALDSNVRAALGIRAPVTANEWLAVLDHVGRDIALFEAANGPLAGAVPARFARVGVGRLYDMVLGPR